MQCRKIMPVLAVMLLAASAMSACTGKETSSDTNQSQFVAVTDSVSQTERVLETTAAGLVLGDANGDGNIDIMDVITINRTILGKETLSQEQVEAIDFNGNNKPDDEDSLHLMKYIVNLIDTLS